MRARLTELTELYRRMLRIRLLEERLQQLCDAGEGADLHFNRGQEAIAVGVCAALEPQDLIVCHHRTIAHHLARGGDMKRLVAELLGKVTGVNGGRAGEMHLSDHNIGHMFSWQLVGTCIPVAAGLAYALRKRRTDAIVAVFFGDAATANGQFHEGVNIAAVHELPLLLVCENNGRAGNVTREHYQPVPYVLNRLEGFGIQSTVINGNSVEFVQKVTRATRSSMLEDRYPHGIECMTERLCKHKQGQGDIRNAEELARAARMDPLSEAHEGQLDAYGSRDDDSVMRREILEEVDIAIERARNDPIAEL
jgi:pyruvate dehydrogenase E1 component alpha subunit